MPFVSEAQRRACYAKNDPRWDCKKWEKETKKSLPKRKVYTGVRGGKYVIIKGVKRYIK